MAARLKTLAERWCDARPAGPRAAVASADIDALLREVRKIHELS